MGRKFDTVLDRARDELFSHIHRCGVLEASEDQKAEWMQETIEFMGERYPALTRKQLDELRDMGIRFCSPVIPHGKSDMVATEEGAA